MTSHLCFHCAQSRHPCWMFSWQDPFRNVSFPSVWRPTHLPPSCKSWEKAVPGYKAVHLQTISISHKTSMEIIKLKNQTVWIVALSAPFLKPQFPCNGLDFRHSARWDWILWGDLCHPQNASNYENSYGFDSETGRASRELKTASEFPPRVALAPQELSPGALPPSSGPILSVQWCLSTQVPSAPPSPTCLPACLTGACGKGRHLGLQVHGGLRWAKQRGQGWLEFLQGRLRVGNTGCGKELGQKGT